MMLVRGFAILKICLQRTDTNETQKPAALPTGAAINAPKSATSRSTEIELRRARRRFVG